MTRDITRRDLLRAGALAGIGVALGASGALALEKVSGQAGEATSVAAPTPTTTPGAGETVPFYGPHQAGLVTPAQQHLLFAAFDLLGGTKGEAQRLLQSWTAAAARLCAGLPVSEQEADPRVPPLDTGEAVGRSPARLTMTFGFGPSLFMLNGVDRFGLLDQQPAELADIAAMPGDNLDPARCGGDICVQACADDPQVAFHAIRNLARLSKDLAQLRWMQLGFSHTVGAGYTADRPRNHSAAARHPTVTDPPARSSHADPQAAGDAVDRKPL